MDSQRRTRPRMSRPVLMPHTEATIDPPVWTVSSCLSTFVKRAVKCAKNGRLDYWHIVFYVLRLN